MSEATRPVGSELISGIVDINRRLTLVETRFMRLAGNPVVLSDTTLTAAAASVTFSSIPQNFSHLQCELDVRGTAPTVLESVYFRCNGDSSGSYDVQRLTVSATAIGASETFASTKGDFGDISGGNAGANLFSNVTAKITHYGSTSNNKAILSSFAAKYGVTAGAMYTGMFASFWRSNAAITQVTIFPNANEFAIGSRIVWTGIP